MLHWETCLKMTGDGTCMILSKEVTGLVILQLFFFFCISLLLLLVYGSVAVPALNSLLIFFV